MFLSQIGGNLLTVPVGGFMALTVAEQRKGRAAGWYQAGNLGGAGLGGGAGVWLVTHLSTPIAGGVICAAMIALWRIGREKGAVASPQIV